MTRQVANDNRRIIRQRTRTLPLLTAIGLLTACCAGTSPEVDQACSSVEQLRADPAVGTNAPVSLQRMEESLRRLDAAAAVSRTAGSN